MYLWAEMNRKAATHFINTILNHLPVRGIASFCCMWFVIGFLNCIFFIQTKKSTATILPHLNLKDNYILSLRRK